MAKVKTAVSVLFDMSLHGVYGPELRATFKTPAVVSSQVLNWRELLPGYMLLRVDDPGVTNHLLHTPGEELALYQAAGNLPLGVALGRNYRTRF